MSPARGYYCVEEVLEFVVHSVGIFEVPYCEVVSGVVNVKSASSVYPGSDFVQSIQNQLKFLQTPLALEYRAYDFVTAALLGSPAGYAYVVNQFPMTTGAVIVVFVVDANAFFAESRYYFMVAYAEELNLYSESAVLIESWYPLRSLP